jgi:hypothetical protein
VTEVRPVQFLKASLAIVVTLLGIIIDVSPVQLLKALGPIDVTLLGIVTDVRAEQ